MTSRRFAAVLLLSSWLLYACGTPAAGSPTATSAHKNDTPRPHVGVNFQCPVASAHYRISQMSMSDVNALIMNSGLSISLPTDLIGLDIGGAGRLEDGSGVVVDLGVGTDRDSVAAMIFSPADSPRCSGPPSGDRLFVTGEGVDVYPFTFSNSVGYISWFKPNSSLAVELSVSWVPHKEPPRREQLTVVKRWITAIYDANKK